MGEPWRPTPRSPLAALLEDDTSLLTDCFLILLDDGTGTMRLRPAAAGLCLAGGILGELLLSGHLTVSAGDLHVQRQDLPADPWLSARFARLLSEPHLTDVRVWLRFFATAAVAEVGAEAARQGWVTVTQRRTARSLGLRSTTAYAPVDHTRVAWRPGRLAGVLTGLGRHLAEGHPAPAREVLLAGLLAGVDYLDRVLWNSPRYDCLQSLRWCLEHHRPMHDLVLEVRNLHDDLVRAPLT